MCKLVGTNHSCINLAACVVLVFLGCYVTDNVVTWKIQLQNSRSNVIPKSMHTANQSN